MSGKKTNTRQTDTADDMNPTTNGSSQGDAPDRSAKSGRSIDQLMEAASSALTAGDYLTCEGLADDALHEAWKHQQYDVLARITLPLQEARRQRRLQAEEAGKIMHVDHADALPGVEGAAVEIGFYLVNPPGVAADARMIRRAAFERRVPVVAFALEPVTQMGLQPVAVVGPCAVRAKVKPPNRMSLAWCLEAIDALTESALMQVDTTRPLTKQVDVLLDLLDALPESEKLHQVLAQTAKAAHRQDATGSPTSKSA